MYKRYFTVIIVLIILIGCFFLFFDKPTNKDLYSEYLSKLEGHSEFDNLADNSDLKISIDDDYINNQYHYVLTFTSTTTLNNFKALAIIEGEKNGEYYPSFGIFDNENINLVNHDAASKETKGVNLVISNNKKVEAFRIYVSYNNYEYFYLINMEE